MLEDLAKSSSPGSISFDVCILGAGILGVCVAFWLSELYDCSIALIDMEDSVAKHSSSRNTGVVHRPFYLGPEKKRFASAALKSYKLWSTLAERYSLPWRQTGVIQVATDGDSLKTLGSYKDWSLRNGMADDEIEVLNAAQLREVEPLVKCEGAILSKKDASVDFGAFTRCVFELARRNGVQFLAGTKADALYDSGEVQVGLLRGTTSRVVYCKLLINAAGGGALALARLMGVAKDYAELHFRGDYWKVEGASLAVSHNIYSVPRHPGYPFLDPHLIVRADGKMEIGPNASLVAGPYVYEGFSGGPSNLLGGLFEGPLRPKLRSLLDREFLSLAWAERKSSVSKKAMCDRVREFLPSLDYDMVGDRGIAGVRNVLLNKDGFLPEVVELFTEHSLHILNYNSPGATGAPAYSARIVGALWEKGYLGGFSKKTKPRTSIWSFDEAAVD